MHIKWVFIHFDEKFQEALLEWSLTSIPRIGGNRPIELAAVKERFPEIMSGKYRASVDALYISDTRFT